MNDRNISVAENGRITGYRYHIGRSFVSRVAVRRVVRRALSTRGIFVTADPPAVAGRPYHPKTNSQEPWRWKF